MSLTPPPSVKAGGRVIPADVIGSVRKASNATGVNFAYLMAQASRESSFRTDVSSTQSSASGLFQFVQSTWLQMMKKHGAKYGYGDMAAKIRQKSGGGYVVDDQKTLSDILALRKNAELSSLMAAEYARSNKQYLEKALGRDIAPADLYIAHFLGPAGAARLLKAHQENGEQAAADLIPTAAQSNKSIFYHSETGQPRTVKALYEQLEDHVEEPIRRYAAMQNETGAVVDPGPTGSSPSLGALIASATTATVKSKSQATQTAVAILAVLEASARSTPVVPTTAVGALEALQNHIAPESTPSLLASIDMASQEMRAQTARAEDFATRTTVALANHLPAAPSEPTPPASSLMAALDTASQATREQTTRAENFAARTTVALANHLPAAPAPSEPALPASSLMAALDTASQATREQTTRAENFATRTTVALASHLPTTPAPSEPAPPASSLMAALDTASQATREQTTRAENFAARTTVALANHLPAAPAPSEPAPPASSLMAALDTASQATREQTIRAENFAARTTVALANHLPAAPAPSEPALPASSLMAALDTASQATREQTTRAENFAARTTVALASHLPAAPPPSEPAPPASSLMAALDTASQETRGQAEKARNDATLMLASLEESSHSLPDFSGQEDPVLALMATVPPPSIPAPERVAQAYVPSESAATYRSKLLASGAIPPTALSPPPQPVVQPLPPKIVVASAKAAHAPASVAENFETLAKSLQG